MARIRSVKPEFWEDELIAELSRDARLLFIATWNLADDEGRLRWAPAYIKSKVFPYDEDIDADTVVTLMAELEQLGRIRAYTIERTTKQRFAVVVNFARHQRINRPQDSNLPPPPRPDGPSGNHYDDVHGTFTESSVSDPGAVSDDSAPEGKGMDGSREGSGEERPHAPDLLERFPDFWATYPRRVKRLAAERAWAAALRRRVDPEHLVAAAKRYADLTRNTETQYIQHPSSWLNGGSYDDEQERPDPPRSRTNGKPNADDKIRDMARFKTGAEPQQPLIALPGGSQ